MSSNARRPVMKREFKVGEHVTWNSEAGHVSGTIIKVHTKDVNYNGYIHHASEAEPQYEIKSDKTDHMQTPEFSANLAGLIEQAMRERIVLMCAEAVPWRCHRSLIADALMVHGIRVEEIINGTRRQVHALTPFARVSGTVITYPPEASPSQSDSSSLRE